MTKNVRRRQRRLNRPEELVFKSCYSPVDLTEMLGHSESRSKIRRLPATQIFYGLRELDDEQMERLLPHITQEQWLGILDLDLWSKDRMQIDRFLHWQKYLLAAEDAVARKLLRGTEPEMWEMVFKQRLKVSARIEEGEFEWTPAEEDEWLQTPDGHYRVVLPPDPEAARLIRSLLLRLYYLEPGWATLLLESCRFRSSSEVEEAAYQNRTHRLEELGFQDYFTAIEVYSPLELGEKLPEKKWERPIEMSVLPARLPPSQQQHSPLLLFQAFSKLTLAQEIQSLVEELFYVCNKVLSADRLSPNSPERVKRGIRKAISGINLGLDVWSEGSLYRATEGVRRHYLQSFFQLGYGRLLELQQEAILLHRTRPFEPGSFEEAIFEGLQRRYPIQTAQIKGRVRRRFVRDRADLERIRRSLHRVNE